MGLLISEPNVKRSKIIRRCLGMKRVPRQSGFALGAIRSLSEREREREREGGRKGEKQKIQS